MIKRPIKTVEVKVKVSEANLKPSRTSTMEFFAKIVDGYKPLIIFKKTILAKSSIIVASLGSTSFW